MEAITPDGARICWEDEGTGDPPVVSPGRGDCSDISVEEPMCIPYLEHLAGRRS